MSQLYTCSGGKVPGNGEPFEPGIFYWLGTKRGSASYENPATTGVVKCSMSSDGGGKSRVESLVSNKAATIYSKNVAKSWFAVDLGEDVLVQPTSYCIRNAEEGATSQPLRNWYFEGSTNGSNWDKISTHTNDDTLKVRVSAQCAKFDVNTSRRYRHFRFFQFDVNGDNKHHIASGGMEIYGVVYAAKADGVVYGAGDTAGPKVTDGGTTLVFQKSEGTPANGAPFDKLGVLYWIGTSRGTSAYNNPHTSGKVTATMSTNGGGQSRVESFVSHEAATCYTDDTESWIQVDLGSDVQLMVSDYVVRNAETGATSVPLRTWELQGQRSGAWVTLDSRTNDETLGVRVSAQCAHFKVTACHDYYRVFRIFSKSRVAVGGIEFYGRLQNPSAALAASKVTSDGSNFVFSGTLPNDDDSFDKNGLFFWLGTKGGTTTYTNPHTLKAVHCEMSSHGGGSNNNLEAIVSNGTNSCYTKDVADSWVSVDIGTRLFVPTCYVIRSCHTAATSQPLRNWELQGSVDKNKWTTLKRHVNDQSIKVSVPGNCAVWHLEPELPASRYFRIYQFDTNGAGKHYCALGGMEFYGHFEGAKPTSLVASSPGKMSSGVGKRFVFSGSLPSADEPFDCGGLFYWLGTKQGTSEYENPHNLKAVVCEVSSHGGGSNNHLEAIVSHATNSFYTGNTENSWLLVDIGADLSFSPSCYCMRTCHTAATTQPPRNWELQGSNDKVTWTVLKRHTDDQSLAYKKPGDVAVWELGGGLPACRYFKIYQFGQNGDGKHYLAIGGMELYGLLCGKAFIDAPPSSTAAKPIPAKTIPPKSIGDGKWQFTFSGVTLGKQDPFDKCGLFYWLGTKRGSAASWTNPAQNLPVSVSSQGGGDKKNFLSHVSSTFYTSNLENSWISVDLGNGVLMTVDYYCMRGCESSATSQPPRNWNLEGSNDNNSWTCLRRHEGDCTIEKNASASCGSWSVRSSEGFRYFRIYQFDKNGDDKNYLACGGIELYGLYSYSETSEPAKALSPPSSPGPLRAASPLGPLRAASPPGPPRAASPPPAKISKVPPANKSIAVGKVEKKAVSRAHGLGFSSDDASGTYKPIAEFVKGFTPQKTCKEYILEDCVTVCVNSGPFLQQTCEEVGQIAMSYLQSPEIASGLTASGVEPMELFAIILYTFDLALICPEGWNGDKMGCFYCELNTLLQSRDISKLAKLKGYLYFLIKALRKLSPWKGTVYRGIDVNGVHILGPNYSEGRKVHFSGMSSAAPALDVAKGFAGEDGVILRMKIRTGRDIRQYSAIPNESEILLLPNIGLIVTEEMHFDDAIGANVIDLVESSEAVQTFVF
eukprot:TRINITY_DN3426_c0_g1_i5.p1 TRINITY_DN3426_c0_g1~~TRINITY_DN3426_c0_g1_i5.p1  ORF type:complete len:1325 (+),score=170.48 TRINITY_DN3426_c0_g1_i5:106-4080(+)